jgi:hypothetical protein
VDIHPPHAPIRSVKDFLIQLVTITAGVLIALSLESLVEWNHYRILVGDARDTIALELADNRKEVESNLANIESRRRDLDVAQRMADELLKTRQTQINTMNLSLGIAQLSSASWQTAERTGALAHMAYDEVRRDAGIYAVQDLYVAQQRRSLDGIAAALAFIAGGDPTMAAPRDVEGFRQQILALRADLLVEEQLGRQLAKTYQATPSK